MGSLQDTLEARREASIAGKDEATNAAMAGDVAEVDASGLADKALATGATFPSFSLPSATGEVVTSDELLADGPVVVTFYRGGWCPYCNLALAALQSRLDDIHAAGGRLVAISPQTPDASLSTAEKKDLTFTVLSDVGNVLAREVGLVHRLSDDVKELYDGWGFETDVVNDGHGDELPLPATFVLDADGTVAWRFVDPDYIKRAEPDDVVAALRGLA